jgi:uncharacterized membrane protein YkoI
MKRQINVLSLAIAVVWVSIFVTHSPAQETKVKVSQLPAAVKRALETACPNCEIDKAAREVENGVTIYDFEFKHGKGEMDITADGLVVSRESVMREENVEAPALAAIRQAAAGGRVAQILREEVSADLSDGKVIKLDSPKFFYEAELAKGDQVAEIKVTPDGQVTEAAVWRKKGTKEP